MTYSIIQPPFTLDFQNMSKKELKAYFNWIQQVLPQRLNELTLAVQQTPGFEPWNADSSPESLDMLDHWFATQVEVRPRTPEEVQAIERHATHLIVEVPKSELSDRTFSIALDVGLYLSQVFLMHHPALRCAALRLGIGRQNECELRPTGSGSV
jgi:hypothetical protein